MIIRDAAITLLTGKNGVSIELHDQDASITFAKISLTPEQFSLALSRLAYTRCSMEVHNLEKIGTVLETKKLEFQIPYSIYYLCSHTERDQKLKEILEEKCPKGWKPDIYFNSQDSFFKKGGKYYARTVIRRWVDKKGEKK